MKCLREDISRLIPHGGAMCLLDHVESWDKEHIVCLATSHQRTDNPLRDDSGLRALCAIEYGAQAIAAHAALLGRSHEQRGAEGVLASLRNVSTTLSHVDRVAGPLTILATLQIANQQGSIYDVTVTGDGRTVLTGRLSVMVSQDGPVKAGFDSTEGVA